MSFGYSSPSLLCREHCSIPAKEQERPKPTNDTGKLPSLTQSIQTPHRFSASLSVLGGTMQSQGTCHPDSVNGGGEGSVKQDTGRAVVLKLDIVACLVKTESSNVGASSLVWMDLAHSPVTPGLISCLAMWRWCDSACVPSPSPPLTTGHTRPCLRRKQIVGSHWEGSEEPCELSLACVPHPTGQLRRNHWLE